MRPLIIFALTVPLLTAQTSADFRFVHIRNTQEMKEIGTLIQAITNCRAASIDGPQGTLSVQGTPDQITLSDWLFKQFDQPAVSKPPQTPANNVVQFVLPGGDDVVRLFYLPYTPTVKDFQEAVVAVRNATDMRWMFTENAQRTVAARGTANQVAFAAWMFDQLGDPQVEEFSSPVYHIPTGNGTPPRSYFNTAKVFHVPGTQSVEDYQEEFTLLRTIADIRQIFTYQRPREVVARGTAGQIALLEWLLPRLDASGAARSTAQFQITDEGADADRVVEVFYLPQSLSVAEFQTQVDAIRKSTGTKRVVTYNAPRIAVVRGNPTQVENFRHIFTSQVLSSSPGPMSPTR